MGYLKRQVLWAGCLLTFLGMTSGSANALPVSLHVVTGKPLVFVDLDAETREPLSAALSIGLGVKVYLPDYPFSVGVLYESLWNTNYGSLPISSSGATISYYPFGKPIIVSDQAGELYQQSLDLVVYGTLGTGLTFFNIRDPSTEGTFVFGASAFNIRASATVEYPVSNMISLGGTFLYQTTFGGTSPIDETSPTVGVTGFSFLAHVGFTLP